MKISEMILREDFYRINEQTLDSYYHDPHDRMKLFVYPHLNAIVTRCPGKKVRRYIYTEYCIQGHKLKKWLIRLYIFVLLHSMGILAKRKIEVNGKVSNEDLIYPCNRKYRIFHFDEQVVTVIVKAGFLPDTLRKEIAFREEHSRENYVLSLLEKGDNYYTERIIDGIPLARIQQGYKDYVKDALRIYEQLTLLEGQTEKLVKDYTGELKGKIEKEIDAFSIYLQPNELSMIAEVLVFLAEQLQIEGTIKLGLSHGDLQPGNIWIERKTNRMYLIDWESWDIRSLWYDKAILLCDIRNGEGVRKLLEDQYTCFFDEKEYDVLKYVVSLEDMWFKVVEVTSLPDDFGVRQFVEYIARNYKKR